MKNIFKKVMRRVSFCQYAAADDYTAEVATVSTNMAAALIQKGLKGVSVAFRNILGMLSLNFSDSVSNAKSVLAIYTRTTPQGDANYANLEIGTICLQTPVTSGAITDMIWWYKAVAGANGWRQMTSGKDGEQCVTVTLTSAQVKALKATPITLVPAPGADLAVVPTRINLVVNYGGTNAFTEAADDLSIGYATGAELLEIESTGLIDQTNDEWRTISFSSVLTETFIPEENKAVVVTNLDDEFAGNAGADNTIQVKLWYVVVPTDA
jgi:hypothetical protein